MSDQAPSDDIDLPADKADLTTPTDPVVPAEAATAAFEAVADDADSQAEDASAADPAALGVERRLERQRLAHVKRRQKWAIGAACALAGIILLAVAGDAIASMGRIHPGVSVGGVNVGGLKSDEAAARLATELPKTINTTVTAVYADKKFIVKSSQMGLSFDSTALATSAMDVGRTGGVVRVVRDRIAAWTHGVSLESSVSADPTKLQTVLGSLSTGVNVAAKDGAIQIKGTSVSVVPAATGLEVDTKASSASLLEAFTASSSTFTLPVNAVHPRISDAAAQSAKLVVERMLSAPVVVTYTDKKWTFSPTDIAKTIVFRTVETTSAASSTATWTLDPYIGGEEVSATIVPKLGAGVGRAAQDADFKTQNGQVVIVPSQEGTGPDVTGLASDLTMVLKGTSAERTVALRVAAVAAKLTTQQAQDMGIKDKISTFTTTYDSGASARVNNIHVLGDALDGTLIAPGAVFSFNGAVGERTAEKGYKEAGAIMDGKLVQQLGGGICQVGTTVFNAAFFSGLPIVERSNHGFYISHYPTGRDATVSWGGPDLKFKNTTGNWLLVSVSYTSSSVTVALYGKSPGYDVTYTTSPLTNIVAFTTQEEADPTLPIGTRIVTDPGQDGCSCVVVRTVTKGGQAVSTDTFKSLYQPKTEIVTVGTKPATP
ncbi:MAG: hypothetical protein HGA39_00335 [Coriobacteriia bacterium]|nr:hypothetical protein [Coriobacteriia bacterium]